MKQAAPIVEYGAAIDPKVMIEPPEVVTPTTNGINVTVKFSGSPAPAYGKTFYVGWSKKTTPNPAHVRVTVNSIKVNRSLKVFCRFIPAPLPSQNVTHQLQKAGIVGQALASSFQLG